MSTKTIRQPSIQRLFIQLLEKQKLQHAYLFEGKSGTGKKEVAMWITQGIFCQNNSSEPCLTCQNCQRIATHQHPDVIELMPDGQSIKIGQVRELKETFSMSGMESRKKIVIVEDVEKMTNQAANSLLKFLEEPEGDSVVFLLTTAKQRILPTILSRCQLIHFPQLSKREQAKNFEEKGLSKERASLYSHLTSDISVALELSENEMMTELVQSVWKWYAFLSKMDDQAFVFIQTDIMPLVKEKKEYYLVLDLLLIIFQDILNIKISSDYTIAFLNKESDIRSDSRRFSAVKLADAMEVVLRAKKHLDSNVSAQGVFENCALLIVSELKK